MFEAQTQAEQTLPLQVNNIYLKEIYSTNRVENIATNLDYQNKFVYKGLQSIPNNNSNNNNNKVNSNGEKKVVKYHRCFTRSPANIGHSLNRPSRPSLPPNMKFTPPNQKLEASDNRNNNTIQDGKKQILNPEMLSGQILFV